MVKGYTRTGVNQITKLDFLTEFPTTRAACYKFDSIKNSFAASGLIPFDPNRVINVRLKTPSPPPSSSSDFSLKTPGNPKQLAYRDGYIAGEANEQVLFEKQQKKQLAEQRAEQIETTSRAPPRCSDCREIGHKRLQCPSRYL